MSFTDVNRNSKPENSRCFDLKRGSLSDKAAFYISGLEQKIKRGVSNMNIESANA
jgi:hypothetical protein